MIAEITIKIATEQKLVLAEIVAEVLNNMSDQIHDSSGTRFGTVESEIDPEATAAWSISITQ